MQFEELHHPSWLVCRLQRVCCVAIAILSLYCEALCQTTCILTVNELGFHGSDFALKETNGTLDTSARVLALQDLLGTFFVPKAREKLSKNCQFLHPLVPDLPLGFAPFTLTNFSQLYWDVQK